MRPMDEQMLFWPFAAGEFTLPCYLREIRGFPILGPQDEYAIAKRWSEHSDRDAAHTFVTSHLHQGAGIGGKLMDAMKSLHGTNPSMVSVCRPQSRRRCFLAGH